MTIWHFRVMRGLRVLLAVARVMPRYAWLIVRDRRHPGDVSGEDWERAHRDAALELKQVALTLAGAFTKAAQIGGARADVLPAAFIEELSQFHDAVPPRPFSQLRALVVQDLGCALEVVFEHVDEEALAAASLAQVHRARLRGGGEVVLKLQYPEARRIIPLDLRMLRMVVALVQRMQSWVDLRSVVNEVSRFIELELDFANEVVSTERLGELLAGRADVRVPRVERELCGPSLIVLEYLDGIQVTRREALVAAGHSLPAIARRIGALYGEMIFEIGFFHGDPHPGNLLVLPDGRIGLLDFGLCKQLPPGFARSVARMMVSAMIGDGPDALAAAAELGFDTSRMRADHLRTLMLKTLGDSDGEEDLFAILSESRIERIPDDFALVARTLILLNGLSERLVPHRRLVQAELIQHLAAGAAAAYEGADSTGASRAAARSVSPASSGPGISPGEPPADAPHAER